MTRTDAVNPFTRLFGDEHVVATGIGSWPGEDFAEAVKIIFAEVPELPYLPELPGRGVQAQLIGRTTAVLSELSVDLQPAGWRLTDAPGVDARRARALLRTDLDQLEEAVDGYSGPIKVAFAGPWTMAAMIERPRGDRVLADHGLRRELHQSLAEGLATQLSELQRRLPAVRLVLQLDEPALPAVLAGSVPTASGFSRHRAVAENEVIESYRALRAAVDHAAVDHAADEQSGGSVPVSLHCCAASPPLDVLTTAGFAAVAVDLDRLTGPDWDAVAGWLESGRWLGAGALPTGSGRGPVVTADRIVERVLRPIRRLGLDPMLARHLLLGPACGLAGFGPVEALTAQRVIGRAAEVLSEQLAD